MLNINSLFPSSSKAKDIPASLAHSDQAFFNSILSYGSYSGRDWIVPTLTEQEFLNSDYFTNHIKNLEINNSNDLNIKKAYELLMNAYVAQQFTAINIGLDDQAQMSSMQYGFSYSYESKLGSYTAMDNLAKAIMVTSDNEDGSKTLHISFRGTDKKAKELSEFALKSYLDMSAYYDCFKPLESAILEYAKDPKNKISKIDLSGHSLGGAMVQEFFNSPLVHIFNEQYPNIAMQGFTYGSPGSKKHILYNLFPNIYHAFKHGKFLTLANNVVSNFFSQKNDDRITHYEHRGDLVPFMGKFLYQHQGKNIFLKDTSDLDIYAHHVLQGTKINTEYSLEFTKNSNNSYNLTPKPTSMYILDDAYLEKKGFFTQVKEILQTPITLFSNGFSKKHDMLRYHFNLQHHSMKLFNQLEPSMINDENQNKFLPKLTSFFNLQNILLNKIFIKNPKKLVEEKNTNSIENNKVSNTNVPQQLMEVHKNKIINQIKSTVNSKMKDHIKSTEDAFLKQNFLTNYQQNIEGSLKKNKI